MVLCVLFAIVGAVPLGLGFLVRTAPVRAWAARETSAILAGKLEVAARYDVVVQAWPVVVALENVVVDASDGGEPFLSVERIAVRPRPFSLLAGRLDVGDVEIVGPRIRAVVEKGKLKNLKFKEPESSGGRIEAPFASLAITDAHIDAWVDGVTAVTHELDVDVSVEEEGAYEISLRAGQTALTRVHPLLGRPGEDAVDDDIVCRAEARVRVQGGGRSLLVRRLLLAGSADFDPDPGTRPSCNLHETDWRAVEVRLGAVRVELPADAPATMGDPERAPHTSPIRVTGRVHAKVPAALAHRFKDLASLTGSIIADLQIDYDGGAQLPHVDGHVATEMVGIDGKVFGKRVDLDLSVGDSTVRVTKLVAQWADGKVTIPEVTIEPFAAGVPITTSAVTLEGLELPGLLRDLGAHPNAFVAWTLETGRLDFLKGHLDPPFIEGPLSLQTRNFEIFDRPASDPLRAHMMGIKEGTVRCNFVINGTRRSPYKFPGIVISKASVDTPKSHLDATVTLGFDTIIDIDVREGTRVDLAELSPLGTIPISGVASLRAAGRGLFEHPKLVGELKLTDFVFAGLPVGEVESPRVLFEPLVLDLYEARLRHGQSRARSPQVRLAFDTGAAVVADAEVDSREAPGLRVRDLFEVFKFDKDPRWAEVDAVANGKARVHYVLGGREDRCGGGVLHVETAMDLSAVSLLGERFDRGTMDADLLWDDQLAGASGMTLDLHSATLRKGEGSVLIGATLRKGGFLRANAVGSGIPLSHVDALGAFAKSLDGTVSVVADVGGTLSALEVGADVNLSRVRIGPTTLGTSRFHMGMSPDAPVVSRPGKQCGNGRGSAFEQAEWDKDLSDGDIKIDGALFDGQVSLSNLRVSRQRKKVIHGRVQAQGLDLGTLANLVPGVAFKGAPPKGSLSATLDIKTLPLAAPERGELSLLLSALDVEREGVSARLVGQTKRIELAADQLAVDDLKVEIRAASGLTATVVAGGTVRHAISAPDLDVHVRVEPFDLGRLSSDVPSVERAAGTFSGGLSVAGPWSSLRYSGSAELRRGELALKGLPVSFSDATIDVDITGSDVRLKKAFARVGGGVVQATGRLPLRGPDAGSFSSTITAHGVKVPVADGINLTADAQLEAGYRPSGDAGRRAVPEVKGTVELTQFSYTRPIALNLSQLGRAPRTNVDAYDPASDVVRFNVNLVSPRPLRFTNNLVDMELEVMKPGLVLSGTNQRFGARGLLRIIPDSKVQLVSNEFLVREGFVRFDDPEKMAPKVDVTAVTEYRRYSSSTDPSASNAGASPGSSAAASAASPVSAAASTSSAGIWRITLHARGETDNLQISLNSDPPLSQEDLVLLLTIGMTRSEISANAALGETAGLLALSTLTGADKAVKSIVPLIDDFRFGTGYSSRTARSEPTVTVGKRITDRVRASVTTGVGEDREVRSNVEWKLNRNISVQGSYDNLNDVSSSPVGNVGVDLRWRIEFE
jgi:translocation and assembly module TamB